MTQLHLSDELIQSLALDTATKDETQQEHLQSCELCSTRLSFYQNMFAGIKQIDAPAFDFDLASLVVARLPQAQSATSDTSLIYWLVGIAVVILAIPVYFFRSYLLTLLSGSVLFIVLMLAAGAIIILTVQAADMYRRYQQRMSQLNLY